MRRIFCFIALLGLLPIPASAWGLTGHYLISTAAAQRLPDEVPAFMRSPAAIAELGALGPELDRSKGSGQPHDADLDPGHYVDLGDDGKIEGVVELDSLPTSRGDYDTKLRGANTNEYAQGYLPYALLDGWEQVRTDFAIWRVEQVGENKAASGDDRAWFAKDRALREILTLRDIGVWGHYVGDASQPLHVTYHFNGWGKFPNPNSYSMSTSLHSQFESGFVRANASLAGVLAHVRPYAPCNCTIQQETAAYLRATWSQVVPLYVLEKRLGFSSAQPETVEFMQARLGDGATAFRDLIVEAWRQSADVKVGYPRGLTPKDAEAGTAIPARGLFGD
ncbi:MAG: S1/P1 Nuclease [Candidatus Eremiobacteraeota bacterium]|nr:S1/P1 Nuclease [Candidatus Eremiobacteraeota bacterium]